jgi:hypothetical protein
MQKNKFSFRNKDSQGCHRIAADKKNSQAGYFSHELARFLFPRNPHQLVMARQRCSLTTPVPVIAQHT